MQIEKVKVDTIVYIDTKSGLQRAKVVGKTEKTVKIQMMVGSRYETDGDGNRITRRIKADKIKEIRKTSSKSAPATSTENANAETEMA